MNLFRCFIAFYIISFSLKAQHDISVEATLNEVDHTIEIVQQITYLNSSQTSLDQIYLNDWANSFSSKTTPLAKRFSENFRNGFHFEKDAKRGRTTINSVATAGGSPLNWQRGSEVDIMVVDLPVKLPPGEAYSFSLSYIVKLPEDKFTRYGVTRTNDYKLKYWLITPAVFDGKWYAYSNKNTDDYFQTPSNFSIAFTFPEEYSLFTDLDVLSRDTIQNKKQFRLQGSSRMQTTMYFEKIASFGSVLTDHVEVVTNLQDRKVSPTGRALLVDRITSFLNERLGKYPHGKILVSDTEYRNSPVYGFNQLPDFISPFPEGFELDMELLKTLTRKYITTTLPLNPRDEHWVIGALQIYLMIEYADTYYPDMKLMGSVANFPVVKWSHASEVEFNDQYPFLYLNMARNNLHQALSMPRDSLVKFNKNIASDYFAGQGFQYLSDYMGKPELSKVIRDFYDECKLKHATAAHLRRMIKQNTTLPVDWFFDEFVGKRTLIDFKIKKVIDLGDSLQVNIRNLRDNKMPVSLYGIDGDEVIFKKWIPPFEKNAFAVVPKAGVRKLALNYDGVIPEFNRRNNYKSTKGLFNKPVQFRLFQDIEDPEYNQLFFMPEFSYNLYDGLSTGIKVYNSTFLPRQLSYKLSPQYGFRSKTIIGRGSIAYTTVTDEGSHYSARYGLSGNTFSYNEGLFYRRLSPYITFAFRDNGDLRRNMRQYINFRNVNIFRDEDPNDPDQEPNYTVFNANYVYSDKNLINYYRGIFSYEISAKFSKISTQFEYRKLFNSNQQLNLRFYAGTFLYNNTDPDSDFFSFALDRPTDYLFDYNYYGRSEDTGLFSQQLIIAEGGFKSQLEPAFANQFIATLNGSTNIWKWIFVYGDIGVVKNKGQNLQGVWDSGIRASLVADYFELYFPLYSSLGWEPGLTNYDQKIRFIVTLDLKTLLGLFTREWY